jgi:SAM-dependent methyltransferase
LIDRLLARQGADPLDGWQEFPWNDPRLSPRVLKLHLDPATNQASRPVDAIVAESAFIDGLLRDALGRPARLCDLTCGPGLYSLELAARGHRVVGVDYGPAPIEHARRLAKTRGLDVEFRLADVREVDFSARRFDAIMMLYAQPNCFPTDVLRTLLKRMRRWVEPDGLLLLDFVSRSELRSDTGRFWEAREQSFLHPGRHIWLEEKRFLADRNMHCHQIFLIDEGGKLIDEYGICMIAYEAPQVEMHLRETGWRLETVFGDLQGNPYREGRSDWLAAIARPDGVP